jgi:ubiquinone/menaquinone biosynthesis C-methylase UbiE
MVEAVVRKARAAGIVNLAGSVGDASRLPYPDATFDGAFLIGVLGEIPDGDAALRELFRVLKSGARVVIGELFVDPDFVPLRQLRARAQQAGFVFTRKTGSPLVYLARFER